jgi:GNAT superfamily N-acetyltransferase
MRLRPATPRDLAAVESIIADAFALYVPRMDRKPGPMLDDYAAHVAAGNLFVLQAVEGVVGLIVLVPKEDHLQLDVVAVSPSATGRGLGRRLVDFAVEECRRRHLPEVRLYTNEAMHENVPLYEHLGFVETHRAVQNGFRRIFMTRRV